MTPNNSRDIPENDPARIGPARLREWVEASSPDSPPRPLALALIEVAEGGSAAAASLDADMAAALLAELGDRLSEVDAGPWMTLVEEFLNDAMVLAPTIGIRPPTPPATTLDPSALDPWSLDPPPLHDSPAAESDSPPALDWEPAPFDSPNANPEWTPELESPSEIGFDDLLDGMLAEGAPAEIDEFGHTLEGAKPTPVETMDPASVFEPALDGPALEFVQASPSADEACAESEGGAPVNAHAEPGITEAAPDAEYPTAIVAEVSPIPVDREPVLDLETEAAPHPSPSPASAPKRPPRRRAALTDIQEVFLEEAREHLDSMTRNLLLLEESSDEAGLVDPLLRSAHSIKGSGALAEMPEVSRVAHFMEDLFCLARDTRRPLPTAALDMCNRGVELIDRLLEAVEWDGPVDADEIAGTIEAFQALTREITAGTNADVAADEAIQELGVGAAPEPNLIEVPSAIEPSLASARDSLKVPIDSDSERAGSDSETGRYVRIQVGQLDSMMNLAADLVINRSRLAAELDKLRTAHSEAQDARTKLRKSLARLEAHQARDARVAVGASAGFGNGPTWNRSSAEARGLLDEFSEDEFERFTEHDALTRDIHNRMLELVDLNERLTAATSEIDQRISHAGKIINELHETALRSRMTSIGVVFNRFPRMVRELGARLGKRVQLIAAGADTLVDRAIIDEMGEPLTHLIRNAIDHGIETPNERARSGKPPEATLRLTARRAGGMAEIEIRDDGRGIDPEKVRARAVQRGWMNRERAERATLAELHQLLFQPGFSTTDSVSDISGRGVGLDVVQAAISRMRGSLAVESIPGGGTTITLRVPLTLVITHALMIKAGAETFALPISAAREIARLSQTKVQMISDAPFVIFRGAALPLVSLRARLGVEAAPDAADDPYIIIVADGVSESAMAVDALIGREEIVIKPLGGLLAGMAPFSGGTIGADGMVRLILETSWILGAEGAAAGEAEPWLAMASADPLEPLPPPGAPARFSPPAQRYDAARGSASKILVVDDSISIRRHVASLLREAGFRVEIASDGLEAVGRLQLGGYRLVLTDLEMPRMNGLELVAEIRGRGGDIPIIVMTSRTGEKHRRKTLELGANDFLEKPFEREKLLETVRQLAGPGAVAS